MAGSVLKNRHYIPASRIYGMKRDGLPSLNSKSIAIDKNGTVWTAHTYHDLFVSGNSILPYLDPWGIFHPAIPGSQYILTCGGIAYKTPGINSFDSVDAIAAGIPYGAYTIDPPFDKNAGARNCLSVAAGPNEVWAGVGQYESIAGVVGSRILRFHLDGTYKDFFDASNSPLPQTTAFASPRAISLHFQSNGTGWVGFNQRRGFGVYKDGAWTYVEKLTNKGATSQLLPGGIEFFLNASGHIASKGGKVFLGTTSGLLIYKGRGDYSQDSSYRLLTTADGLPSNNIRGVTTDKEFIWIATDKGIAQVPIDASLFIYHLDDFPLDPLTVTNRTLLSSIDEAGSDDIATSIAADSSSVTLFVYKTLNADRLRFSIDENANPSALINQAEFGHFKVITRTADSIKVQYQHPRFIFGSYLGKENNGREVTLVVTDTTTNTLVLKTRLKFLLPPVLLVHGVWTDISSLEALAEYLTNNKDSYRYANYQILRKYRLFGAEKEKSFREDANEVPDGIRQLLAQCAEKNVSAGKVNIVAHSRGGLYTRAYIEELEPDIPYRHDIHSLITLNTPHSGSQLANLVLDERILLPGSGKIGNMVKYLIPSKGDRIEKNGAWVLRVDKGFIIDLNQEAYLRKIRDYKVPVHAFATNFELCKANPVLCLNLPKPILRAGRFNFALLFLLFLVDDLPQGIDGAMKSILGDEKNDFIVPRSSMVAGLREQYVSYMDGNNIPHCNLPVIGQGITESIDVVSRVSTLLKQNLQDGTSNFSFEGFDPPRGNNRLRYTAFPLLSKLWGNPPPEHRVASPADKEPSLVIAPSLRGKNYKLGDTIHVAMATSNIEKMLITYETAGEDDDQLYSDLRIDESNPEFLFSVPAAMIGKIRVTAYGFNKIGLVAMDTSHVMIGLPEGVKLVRLMIEGNKEVFIREGEVYPFSIKGLYSDSVVRDLTIADSVQYIIRDAGVIGLSGYGELTGKDPGSSNLLASANKTGDSITVYVLENPLRRKTLPDNFTGRMDNARNVYLEWLTYQEYRTAYFVVERSFDRTVFDSVGVRPGGGTRYNLALYSFSDPSVANDPVYYRLRWVDSAGESYYSRIFTVSAGAAAGSLPVTLVTFTGKFVQNKVRLQWTTAAEHINQRFDIEAAHDGSSFVKIGEVPGSGTSDLQRHYLFDDQRFFRPGKNYYRLKQVDRDGMYRYSAVVVVTVDEEKQSSISLYPNPAKARIVVGFTRPVTGPLQLRLLDIEGRQLWRMTMSGNNFSVPVDLPSLSAGVYLITITNARREKLLTEKLIIRQ